MSIKKFLTIIVILVSIVLSIFTVEKYNMDLEIKYRAYPDTVGIIENKKVIPISVVINQNNEQKTSYFIKQLIQHFKDKTFMITYNKPTNKAQISYCQNYYTQNQSIIDDLKSRGLSELKFNDFNETGYYTTELLDKSATDYIHIIDNNIFNRYDELIEIGTISKDLEFISSLDEIAMCFYDNDVEQFEKDFNTFLDSIDLNISYENFTEGYHGAQIQEIIDDNTHKLTYIIGCISFIYVLMFMVYFSSKKKIYMIQRMHGISLLHILKDNIINLVVIHFVIFNLLFYGFTYYLTKGTMFKEYDLFNRMMHISNVLLLCFLGVMIVLYILLHFITSIRDLKKSQKNLFLILIIKVLVLVLLTGSMIDAFVLSYNSISYYYNVNKYKDKITDLCYIDGNLRNSEMNDKVFNYYLNHNGIYCNFDTYYGRTYEVLKESFGEVMNEEDLLEQSFHYPLVYVNTQYLKTMNQKIYTKDGVEINLDHIKEDVLLTPSRYKNENFELAFPEQKKCEIIEIANTGTFVNFWLEPITTLSNPVIYLTTHHNMYSDNQYLFIPFHHSIENIKSEIKDIFHEDVELVAYNKRLDSKILDIKSELRDSLLITVVYITMYVCIIYQSVFWFIEEFKKSIIIEYLFGKSRLERYQYLFVISIIFYSIPFAISLFYNHIELISLIKLYGASILFEIMLMIVFIRRYENNRANTVLKGEGNL